MKSTQAISTKTAAGFLSVFLFLLSVAASSQNYVNWTPAAGNLIGLNGSFTGGTVMVMPYDPTGSSIAIVFESPSTTITNLDGVSAAQTFDTGGATNAGFSMDLVFNFSTPVIIDRYNMADIDTGSSWNDSFIFLDIVFGSTSSTNCGSSTIGATAGADVGTNSEYASWFTSTVPTMSFTLSYLRTAGLTHARLAYSLSVTPLPYLDMVAPLCPNSIPPVLPATDRNGVTGTWSPAVIDTSTPGTTSYTFTPNPGEPITHTASIDITILPLGDPDCCPISLTLGSPLQDVGGGVTANREADQIIVAANVIAATGHAVYHAGNYVMLDPGFEADAACEFAAYVAGCDGSATYRKPKPALSAERPEQAQRSQADLSHYLRIYPNPSNGIVKVEVINGELTHMKITSIDGKVVFDKFMGQDFEIDVSGFQYGIYLVEALSSYGHLTSKFIKN